MTSIFTASPSALAEELTETLVRAENVRIERIVSNGQASPEGFWCDQAENEFVLVVRGAARLRLEDKIVEMKPGDWLHIAAHRKHRVEWTTPDEMTVWLAVF